MKLAELMALPLEMLIPTMREWGISSISNGAFSFSLGPAPAPTAREITTPPNESPVESLAPCGHPYTDVNDDGLCLHGCLPINNEVIN